jgi:hypothetical protein
MVRRRLEAWLARAMDFAHLSEELLQLWTPGWRTDSDRTNRPV